MRWPAWNALAAFQALGREGLAAHYEFDGSLADSSGHYLYGRVTHGDLTYSNGAVDRGADFDGETRAEFGHIAALDAAKPFAIAFWLKVNGKPKENLLRQQGAIEAGLTTSNSRACSSACLGFMYSSRARQFARRSICRGPIT